MKVEIVLN